MIRTVAALLLPLLVGAAAPLLVGAAAPLLVGASASAEARSPAELKRLFPLEAEIRAAEGGLVRLILPSEVLRRTRPDLSDLRVFDARDREVAFLVDATRRHATLVKQEFEPKVVGLEREQEEFELGASLWREVYEISAPPAPPDLGGSALLAWELVFETPRTRFVREVTVQTADGTILAEGPLFRLDGATRRTRIPLPALSGQEAAGVTLRVRIEGREGSYLEPTLRFESARWLDPRQQSTVALEELARERRDGKTVIEVARPSGVVPDLLRVETATGAFSRPVTVFDEPQGEREVKLGAARVFRVEARRSVEQLQVKLQPARGATLRVEILDEDSPPLEGLRFSAVVRRPVLIFELPAASGGAESVTGTLRYGGGRAHRPRYDLTALLLRAHETRSGLPAEAAALLYDPTGLPLAEVGPERANPFFDPTPALAFAMHPGAAIDARIYSHRRAVTIAPSDEGLSRLRLAPEDAALSEADLADLRVVGAGSHQWPYLLRRDAHRERVALDLGGVSTRKRATTYPLVLPVRPLRADQITFRSPAPYFDRGYRLIARAENGTERTLAQGRLVKRARTTSPVRIGFSRQAIHELELVVEDGDDAPLAFEAVVARAWVPELYLVAPQGSYSLLVGDPDAKAPRYELERVRDVVLAVSSSAATPGKLEDNPAYSMSARLGAGNGATSLVRRAAVWGVLLLAVAVLATLTWRIARRETTESV